MYQRLCVPNGQATVHIVVGTAGAGLETGGFSPSLGNWSLVQLQDWGYSRIQADMSQVCVCVRERERVGKHNASVCL